jgi:hypothetical protein
MNQSSHHRVLQLWITGATGCVKTAVSNQAYL